MPVFFVTYHSQCDQCTLYLASGPEVREESKDEHCQANHDEPVEGRGKTRGKTHSCKDGGIE